MRARALSLYAPIAMHCTWYCDLTQVSRQAWDALDHPPDYPFLEWDWLVRLERSRSVGPSVGWMPMHLTLWSKCDLIGAAALYIKTHGQGEFIFDRIWAEAAEQYHLPYYPKLVGTSPFTPVPGYRFLYAPQTDREQATQRMVQEMHALVQRLGLGGIHFFFAHRDWVQDMKRHGFLAWQHQCYEWRNTGFTHFDDFLTTFRSSQRKNVKKELRRVREQGLSIRAVPGQEMTPEGMQRMYSMYERTNDRYGPWNCKFLTPTFFDALVPALGHRLLFMQAEDAQKKVVAMSMFVRKDGALYGRYWGALDEYPFLHFALCYYQPIAWAVEHGIERFDPGAGSMHKAKRGFISTCNHSLHWLAHPGMRALMQDNIQHINSLEQEHIDSLNTLTPYKKI